MTPALGHFLARFCAILCCVLSINSGRAADTQPVSRTYKVQESFNVGPGVFVRALSLDPRTNALWVGTSVGALSVNIASGNMNATYTRDNGLANEYVFSTFVDKSGGTWFGMNGGGAARLADGKWRTYFPMHGLADYWVYSFAQRNDGKVWIGTWAGLSVFDPKKDTFHTYLKELVNEWVYGLAVDAKDRIWVGTEGGINMFDGRRWQTWTHKDGLGADNKDGLPFSPNTGLGTRSRHDLSVLVEGKPTYNPNYIFCVLAATDGSIWAGTWGGGVAKFDGKAWRNFTHDDGLAGNIVYSVAQAPDGALWFGTSGGLSRFDGQHWQSWNKADGLLDEHVYALAASAKGEVWAGTREGVARLAR